MLSRLLAACSLALLLAGCLPDSVNPLTPAEEGSDAPEILGLWEAQGEDARLYVHVMRGNDSSLEIVLVSHEADGSGSTELYVGHVSEIEGQRYLNLQTIGTGGTAPAPFWFFQYDRNDKGRLIVRFLSSKTLASAVAEGRLTGTVEKDSFVHLTGEALEIAAFLAAADPAELFDREIEFRRVEPSGVP